MVFDLRSIEGHNVWAGKFLHSIRSTTASAANRQGMMVRVLIAIWAVAILGSLSAHAQSERAEPTPPPAAADDETPADDVAAPSERGALSGSAGPFGTRLDALQVGDDGEGVVTPSGDVAFPFPMPGETGAQHAAAYVASVKFNGEVIAGFADGQLVTEIIVTRDHGWHLLNLNLNQAICRNWEYEFEGDGEGESSPVITPVRDDGLSWQFRGIGRHRLTLTMRIRIQRTSTGHQLQLALPPLPREFETLVELRFGSNVRVRRPDGETMFAQSTDDAGRTIVNAGVSGPRLELNWEGARADVAQVAEVRTAWSIRGDQTGEGNRLFASADQDLLPEHGALEYIDVRLPAGWELISVTGERYSSHEILPEAGLMRVHLTDADSQFHLQWYFRRDIAGPRAEVLIAGLEVSGAGRQSGDIAVETLPGWDLSWLPNSSEGVDRRAPAFRLGAPAGGLTFGYQFQPFRLTLDVKESQSLAVIQPRWFVNATEERLELQAEFEIDELGDAVRQLQIVWKDAAQEGWRIEWINDPAQNEIDDVVDVAFQSGSLRLLVPENSNVIRMRLSRPIPSSGSFDFTLPGVEAPLVEPGWLILHSDDAVVLETSLADGAAQFAVSPSPIDFPWPSGMSRDAATQMPYSTDQGPLHAILSVHSREIDAVSTVTIESLAQQWVSISQKFDLEIRYGRLASIELSIPDALYEHMRPQASPSAIEFQVDGKAVAFRWPDPDEPKVELDLSNEPLRGPVTVEARFKFPWDQSQGDRLSLPVLALSSPVVEATTTRCSIPSSDLAPLIVEGQGWTPIPTAPDTRLWEFAGTTLAVPLALAPAQPTQLARQSVTTAFCTVIFQSDGGYRVVADYSIAPDTQMWSCELPATARGEQFFLDDQPVLTQRATLNGRTSHVLRLMPDLSRHSTLRIEYAIPAQRRIGIWGEADIELPRVSESIWIEEIFLEAVLPDGVQLFNSPRGWTHEFAWQRTGFFWTRQPTSRLVAAREAAQGSQSVAARGSSHYGFSRFGATPSLSLTWMSRPLIVLLGAGVTLLLGFLLTRYPAFRGPLPILCLGFAISIVGLWYPEPLELLLQPALLGLVLAWGASRLGAARRYGAATGLEPRVEIGSQKSSSLAPTGTFPGAPAANSGTQSTIYRPLAHFGQASSTTAPPK
jgi:hypothetical protein